MSSGQAFSIAGVAGVAGVVAVLLSGLIACARPVEAGVDAVAAGAGTTRSGSAAAGSSGSAAGQGAANVPGGRLDAGAAVREAMQPGYGSAAQTGLPEVPLSFVNPDGSVARLTAEVASTESQHMTGLMYRQSMARDRAMIFVFQDEQKRYFYMKNTYIPLDMVFVSGRGEVLGVVENNRPLSLESRGVDAPAKFVVEINAWEASRLGIRAGSLMRTASGSVLSF